MLVMIFPIFTLTAFRPTLMLVTGFLNSELSKTLAVCASTVLGSAKDQAIETWKASPSSALPSGEAYKRGWPYAATRLLDRASKEDNSLRGLMRRTRKERFESGLRCHASETMSRSSLIHRVLVLVRPWACCCRLTALHGLLGRTRQVRRGTHPSPES